MMITAYTHTGRTTSTGRWPRDTRTLENPGTIAVDTSVIPYGTLLYVTGYGYGVAEDTGVNGNQLDCFMGPGEACRPWGRPRNVHVYIVQYNYSR
jgi:3D (Asp-Asp-Asp) domain-containing protein